MDSLMERTVERNLKYERSADIEPQELIEKEKYLIVWVGATGRQVAKILATMGARYITLVDPERVELVNVGSQGYTEKQVGKTKVSATLSDLKVIGGTQPVQLVGYAGVYNQASLDGKTAVFSCADSMACREQLYNDVQDSDVLHAIDSRMGADVSEVYLMKYRGQVSEAYRDTLFSDEDALQEACTARTTFYGATLAASLLVGTYVKCLRNSILWNKVRVDMFGGEWISEGMVRNV